MSALTILDEIRVARPCRESWDAMPGDDRARSCPACERTVYNIAALTSAEVAALIAGREGRLCARLFRRVDGTVVTADCPADGVKAPPAPRASARFRRVRALGIVLVALLVVRAGLKPGESPPSGAGVTWDDWVQWAAVSLGLRPTPPAAPLYCPTTATMGDLY